VRSLGDAVFGSDGLAKCNDPETFDQAALRIRDRILPMVPERLQVHYNHKVEPLLRENMECGCRNWVNNACESVNHEIKQYTEWGQNLLPDLAGKLRKLVVSQFAEADRAICSTGDFRLAPTHVSHQVPVEKWVKMTTAERQRKRKACFQPPQDIRSGHVTVTSSDGEFSVNYRPTAGKKILQRKRSRAERATTVKHTGLAFFNLKHF
jgi:hypothetical protein